jgi:hypothetical protein
MAALEEIDTTVLSIHRNIAIDQDVPPLRRAMLSAIQVHSGRDLKDNFLAFSFVTPSADLLDLSAAEQRFELLSSAITKQRAETLELNQGRHGKYKQHHSIFVNMAITIPLPEGAGFEYSEISEQMPIDVKPGHQAFAAKCIGTLTQADVAGLEVAMIKFQYGESDFYLASKHVQAIVGDQGVILKFDQEPAEEPRPPEAAVSRATSAAVTLYTDALLQYSAVTERFLDLVYANSTDGLQTTLIELKSVTSNPLLLGPLIMARLMGDGTGATEAEIWRLQNKVLEEFSVTYDAADVSTAFDSIRRVLKSQKDARDKSSETDAYDLAAWNKWMISGVVRDAMISAGFRQFIMLEENMATPGACIGDHFKTDQKLMEFKARITDFVRKNPQGQVPSQGGAGAAGYFTQGQRTHMQDSAERSKGREQGESAPMQIPSTSDKLCRLHLSAKYRNDLSFHTLDSCSWWTAFKHQSGIASVNHDKALVTLHSIALAQKTKITALKGVHYIAGKTVNLDHVIEAHLKSHAEQRQLKSQAKHGLPVPNPPAAKKPKNRFTKAERTAFNAAKALAASTAGALAAHSTPVQQAPVPQPASQAQITQQQQEFQRQQAYDASMLQNQFLPSMPQAPPRMPPMHQGHVQSLMQPQSQFGQQFGGGVGQQHGGGAGQAAAQQAYSVPQMPHMPPPNQLRQGWHSGASSFLASASPFQPASGGGPAGIKPEATQAEQELNDQNMTHCKSLVRDHNRRQSERGPRGTDAPWIRIPTYVSPGMYEEAPSDIILNLLQKIDSLHVDNAQAVKTMRLLQEPIPVGQDTKVFPRVLGSRKGREKASAKKGALGLMIRADRSSSDGIGIMFEPLVEKGSGVAFLAHSQVSTTDRSSVFQDPQQFNYWNQSSIDPQKLQALVVQSCPPGNCIALVAKTDPSSLTTEGSLVQAALSQFAPMRSDAPDFEHETRRLQIIETVHKMMQACSMPPVIPAVQLMNSQILPAALDSGVTTAREALRQIDIMLHGAAMSEIRAYSTQPTTMTDGSVITDVNVGDGAPQRIVGRVGMTIQLSSYVQSPEGPQTGRVVATFQNVQASLVPSLMCTLISTSMFTEAGCAYTEWPRHYPAPNNAASVHTLDNLAAPTGNPPTLGDPILRAFQAGPGTYSGIKLVGLKILETYPPSFESPRLLGVQIMEPSESGVSTLAAHIAMEKSRAREVANFRQGRSS